MALYEVIMKYLLHGKTVMNTFNYVGNAGNPATGGALHLLQATGLIDLDNHNQNGDWWFAASGLGSGVQGLASSAMRFVEAAAINVYDPTDFYQVSYTHTVLGMASGTATARFLSYPFWTNQTRRDVRRGQKGIPGVVEEYTGADGVIVGGGVSAMQALAAIMSDEVTGTSQIGTFTFEPCVVSKEFYIPDENKPERSAYRYYEAGLAAQMEHVALGVTWSAKDKISTRNSRKD